MKSLLEGAIAAKNSGDAATADKLFHQFVISVASSINESMEAGTYGQDVAEDEEFAGEDDSDLEEGKTYKRNSEDGDNTDEKKKSDQETRRARRNEQPVEEGKTHKRNDDEDTFSKKERDQQRRQGGQQKRNGDADITEGKLTATQGDDGELTIVHEPGAPEADVDHVAPTPDIEPKFDNADALDDVSIDDDIADALGNDFESDFPGMDDLNPDAYAELKESTASDLKTIEISNKDGEQAVGGSVQQERHSPVPNVEASKRFERAAPVQVKSKPASGFDREDGPKVDFSKLSSNARKPGSK